MSLTYTDFLYSTLDISVLNKGELWTIFKHLDTNNKNKLSRKSLIKAFKRTSTSKSEIKVQELMKELNMSKYDEITFDKFC